MKKFHLFLTKLILFTVFITFIRCNKDETSEPNAQLDYSEELNVSYGPHERHKMDVYLPKNRNYETKVVVAVHGGGFFTGNKEDINMPVAKLVDNGYAVININYRLVDTTGVFQNPIIHQPSNITISEQLEDIGLAIDFALGKTNDWTVSKNKWAMFGHSAGATLSLLYTHSDHNNDGRIKAVGNLAGSITFSFDDESEFNLLDSRLVELIARAIGAKPVNANKLAYMAKSPYWVTFNEDNPQPTINIRPENDNLSPDGGAALFNGYKDLLTNKGVPNQYIIVLGADHGFSQAGKWQEAAQKLSDFFAVQIQ